MRFNLNFYLILSFFLVPALGSAQINPQKLFLWENGAPGFEDRRDEPEQAKGWWVRNIHNPSLIAFFPPKDKANGTAVVICPGGGHQNLVYKAEGLDAAEYLNSLGITAFVLKYRLAREENSPYSLEKHPRQDAYRAMRLVRSRAKEWGIAPDKIGMMGFSAGGEVVSAIAYESGHGDAEASDPIDRFNGKPNFQILIYPGPLWIPHKVPENAPPAFLVAAIDDPCCAGSTLSLLQNYYQRGIPAEGHIYSRGSHAFNMGYSTELKSISGWPQRMADWLDENDFGLKNRLNNRSLSDSLELSVSP